MEITRIICARPEHIGWFKCNLNIPPQFKKLTGCSAPGVQTRWPQLMVPSHAFSGSSLMSNDHAFQNDNDDEKEELFNPDLVVE
jgi:hypothetical protein